MLIDEATIIVRSGNGGSGRKSFFPAKGGPNGGDGGDGGAVYAVLNENLSDLKTYAANPHQKAESGEVGGINRMHGKNGKDLMLSLPPHTNIIDLDTGREREIDKNNPKVLLCRGGRGGLGNDALKSATDQAPMRAEPGKPGVQRRYRLVMKLLAQFGLIGLPNAGKSSLINMLTALNARVGDYPFTTLTPNLGVFQGQVIADIPGLIEGASQGKGLGTKFLKHIEKVNLLLHCIAADSENIRGDYDVVTQELQDYGRGLGDKKRIILLTKTDLVSSDELQNKMKALHDLNIQIIPISVFDEPSLEPLKKILLDFSSTPPTLEAEE